MPFDAETITAWVASFAWPWIRVSTVLLVAPFFGNVQLPMNVRIFLGVVFAIAIMPAVGPVPEVDLLSLSAVFIAVQQVLAGLVIGVLLNLSFQAITIAGESISLTMGLGFATMVDPNSGSLPVLSQFLLILATLLFLAVGGHLMLLELLVASFQTLPVGTGGFSGADFLAVAAFGAQMFAGAVLIALPAVVILLVVQLAMGVMTRAAPQMNIFSVGFPLTMMIGFLAVLFLVLPVLQARVVGIWSDAFGLARQLLGG